MFDWLKKCYDPETQKHYWDHTWTAWESVPGRISFLGGWRVRETTVQVRECIHCGYRQVGKL